MCLRSSRNNEEWKIFFKFIRYFHLAPLINSANAVQCCNYCTINRPVWQRQKHRWIDCRIPPSDDCPTCRGRESWYREASMNTLKTTTHHVLMKTCLVVFMIMLWRNQTHTFVAHVQSTFFLKLQPSVSRARPPVG